MSNVYVHFIQCFIYVFVTFLFLFNLEALKHTGKLDFSASCMNKNVLRLSTYVLLIFIHSLFFVFKDIKKM